MLIFVLMENNSKYKDLETLILNNQKAMIVLSDKVDELSEQNASLKKTNEKLNKEVIELIDSNIELDCKVDNSESEIIKLERELKKSKKENSELRTELDLLKNKLHRKNSRNSSIPPSQDPNRKKRNQSLRGNTTKKKGGQQGHKGKTLEFYTDPTEIINHYPKSCECCGNNEFSNYHKSRKRQVVDLPEMTPDIYEHWTFKGVCTCGHQTEAAFPKDVKAPISYGPRTTAVISYLSVRQYVPIKRIEEMFRQLYGMKISASTINNKLAKSSDKLLKLYTWIHNEIQKSSVAGSDETGCNVNGKKGWMWVWQTNNLTYLRYSDTRGAKTINDVFPNGLPNTIMVHDCLNQQFLIKARGHQICIAHLLRELNYFIEIGSSWSKLFKQRLCISLDLLKLIKHYPKKNYRRRINKLNKEIDVLLTCKRKKKKKVITFINRLIKRRKSLLRYLDDPSIPPDNNASERAFRNVKVKLKVSGMFKSDIGADQFAIIRSVIDTFIKRDQPVMKSLIKALS